MQQRIINITLSVGPEKRTNKVDLSENKLTELCWTL